MNAVLIVAIVFGGLVLALTVIGATILMAIRIRHGGYSKSAGHAQAEEARMIQEIYDGLGSMEKRIESLETILMNPQGKEINS